MLDFYDKFLITSFFMVYAIAMWLLISSSLDRDE